MVLIPAGEFTMGSDQTDKDMLQQRFGMRKIPYQNEHPPHQIALGEYYIDKTEVTMGEYEKFVNATNYTRPSYWLAGPMPENFKKYPVVMVSWFNGDAYCRWKGKRLPSEAEWEKAARGKEGFFFPWGNEFDQKKTNSLGLQGGPTNVEQFPTDVSSYGVVGMAGNASEWVQEWYQPYPGNNFLDEAYGEQFKVLRGGSWGGIGHYSFDLFYRTVFRNYEKPEATLNDVGFRCAYSKK
jgi:formylglycine-generating enzyme required for sulfatase activity